MKGFVHKNVVAMYGVMFKEALPYVLLEYMDLGDLKTYISDPDLVRNLVVISIAPRFNILLYIFYYKSLILLKQMKFLF